MFHLLNKSKYDDELIIKLKGLVSVDEEGNPKKILMTKQYLDGDYYILVNTLLHYAILLYLNGEENPKRLDFNEWANKAYIETVSGGNIDEL